MGEKVEGRKDDEEEENQETDLKKPVDPKRVLKILEYRRRILAFVESMLEPEITPNELQAGEEILCQADYDSIVQERYILKICGYPLCSNQLERIWKQKFHVSLRDKRIYDVEIRKLYCSVKCMNSSANYRDSKLPQQPIWMRIDDAKIDPNFEIRTSNP